MANKKSGSRQSAMKQRKDMISDLLSRCTCYGPLTDDALKAIISIVTKVIAIEKTLVHTELPNRVGKMEDFITFCNRNGVDTSAIEIVGQNNSDFGLIAKRDLLEDEMVLCIPCPIILTADQLPTGDAAFTEFATQDPLLKEMPNLLLVMILIREFCDKQSLWKPYMEILPAAYETPLYMDYEMLLCLKPSSAFQASGKLVRNIARQFAYFWTQMNDLQSPASRLSFKHLFTYDLYRWAVCTVMTRQNLIPSSDAGKQVNALIPLWDLCNHELGKFSTDYSIDKNAVICYAMKNFPAGCEIKIFYGERSDEEFLIHNGFVHSENPFNYIFINLGISRNDKLAGLRTSLCSKAGVAAAGKFRLMHKRNGLDPDLLCFLRIFLMDAGQIEHWLTHSDDMSQLKELNCDGLLEIDRKVCEFLTTRTSLLLRTYPSDDNIAKIGNTHIRRLIIGERDILQSHTS